MRTNPSQKVGMTKGSMLMAAAVVMLSTMSTLFGMGVPVACADALEERNFKMHDGTNRDYGVHLPPSAGGELLPVLFVLHGGGGPFTSEEKINNLVSVTGFNQMADREKFIVIYPMGITPHWDDGRPEMPRANDLQYLSELIAEVVARYHGDPSRVYATGVSNGAFFANYLGLKLADQISAIASVCGPIPSVHAALVPSHPVSALLIDGTADAKVPFEGGGINRGASGYTMSHDAAVKRWLDLDGGARNVVLQREVGSPPVKETIWKTGSGKLVGSVVITGGRHGWNTGQAAGFDTSDFIWTFFKMQAGH